MQGRGLELTDQGCLFLGYPLHLTPTELHILQAMVESSGRTVRTQALLQCFAEGNATQAALSVHVCAINKKAQSIGGRKLLRFIRGRGYAFCDDI